MDFAGTGKATAEATWPAIFQALCDTGANLNKLLVETKGLRDDMGTSLGVVVTRLESLIETGALQQAALQQVIAGMGLFRTEVNALTTQMRDARDAG